MKFSFKAAQVKRSKEGQVDLVSPDSILTKINCKVSRIERFCLLNLLKMIKDIPSANIQNTISDKTRNDCRFWQKLTIATDWSR